MKILKCLFFISCLVFISRLNSQWCCLDSTLMIQDESTVNLRLLITGAFNNDLASASQGLCGVRIKFDHQFIGDLTVDLISPSGQRVRLIGPIGNSGISSFSKWFVSFVPCSSTAVPDPGFKKKWDNIQSWGILGKFYNGTYYPQSGCLEDFNLGTVDGLWTLSIGDDKKFYQGKIESFCLLFCDQTGINCEDCSPNGGLFANTNLNYCLGDSRLAEIDTVTFPIFTPDTGYAYRYIVSLNDTILQIKDKPDLSLFPVGNYIICGVSYLKPDSIKLPVVGQLLTDFKNALVLNQIGFCGELSKNCLELNVHPDYNGIVQQVSLCKGDSIRVGNTFYNQSGVYNISLTSAFGCDSIIELHLDVIDLKINAAAIDTLDCQKKKVSIDLTNSLKTNNTAIQWSTFDGNFSDLSNPLIPVVDKEGTYKVIFSDATCLDSAEFTVYKKEDIPDLLVSADTIDCFNQVVNVNASSNVLNPTYRWSNGSVDMGVDSTIRVNQPGLYYVTITDENGCTNFSSIEVNADTSEAKLMLDAGILSCRDTLTTLRYTADRHIIDLLWVGPDQFMSTDSVPIVGKPGNYQLTVQAENGCVSTEIILVQSIATIPDYTVNPDTINCMNHGMILLNASTNSILDSIAYTSPSGVISRDLMPILSESGRYLIHIVDTAGCVLDTFVDIQIDTGTARFLLSTKLLDCANDSVQLLLKYTSTDTINTILWTGPPGFNTNTQSPFAKEVGLYTVVVTSSNGCSIQDTITVMQDSQKPIIQLSADTLDCKVFDVIINASVQDIVRFEWSGPNGFSSFIEDPVVRDSGIYKLVVTASNGCTSEKTIAIIADRNSPIRSLIGNSFNCKTDSVLLKLVSEGVLDSIRWNGPGLFKSTMDSFYIHNAGVYQVFAIGKNGCVDSNSIIIGYDTLTPIFTLSADTLSCRKPVAVVSAFTLDTSLAYGWLTPGGDTLSSKDISVVEPGWYTLTATAQNGCSLQDSIEVIDKRMNPDFRFLADSIICSDSIAELSIVTNDFNIRYQWSGPKGFNSMDSVVQVTVPGWYHYTVINAFNCIVSDSFLVNEYLKHPRVSFSDTVFNCLTISNPVLNATLIDSLELFEWVHPNGAPDPNRSILANRAGKYLFRGENVFGCIIDTSFNVVFDTLTPMVNNISIDSLTCSIVRVVPLVETIPGGMDYNWKGPGNFSSQFSNPILTVAGNYSVTITAANFCVTDTVITLVADTLPPKINAIGGEIDCSNLNVKLDIVTNDSLDSVTWQTSLGAILNGRQPVVVDTGWYIVIVQGINDCLAFDSAYVSVNKIKPQIIVKGTSIPCNPDSSQIEVSSMDSSVVYLWSGPNGFTSTSGNPYVKDTGYYKIKATGSNLCETNDSVHVDFNKRLPDLLASGGTINCKDSAIQLKAIFDTANVKFIWSSMGLQDSSHVNPIVSTPGFYNIKIINSAGCVRDTTIQVVMDTLKPVIQLAALDSLICEQKNIRLSNQFQCNNCVFNWSTVDGILLSNQNNDTLLVNGTGTYTLELINNSNGCKSIGDYILDEFQSTLRGVSMNVVPPSCFGLNDGQVIFDSIKGGVSPYQISIDGKSFQSLMNVNNLRAGTFQLFIKDRYGCIYDTLIQIVDPAALTLSLGRDTVIPLGHSYQIVPSTNGNTGQLKLISWNPTQELDCANCFTVWTTPKSTIRYVLNIMDENGCTAEDDIVISIIDKPRIYFPNSFSPNRDQINDYFTLVTGGDPVKVESFQVFDRWGNMVFSKDDFEISDQLHLWDGTFQGELMNPGVYVYKIELRLANGTQYIQAGDLTLIR